MRKLLTVGLLFFISCSNDPKDEVGKLIKTDSMISYMTIESLDGSDSLNLVKFTISSEIVDSLKISESTIRSICEESAIYADWDVNHKRTYKFQKSINLVSLDDDGNIRVSVYGIASNAFGVEGDILTIMKFYPTGGIVMDEDGMLEIHTF